MKANHYQLVENHERIFASKQDPIIPTNSIPNKQQQNTKHMKTFTPFAILQNNPFATAITIQVTSLVGNGTTTQSLNLIRSQKAKWLMVSIFLLLVMMQGVALGQTTQNMYWNFDQATCGGMTMTTSPANTNLSGAYTFTGNCSVTTPGIATTASALVSQAAGNTVRKSIAGNDGTIYYWYFTLSGSDLSLISNYQLYFQMRRSLSGQTLQPTISYSVNGGAYTGAQNITVSTANAWTAYNYDFSGITGATTSLAFRIQWQQNGAGACDVDLDNFQVQGTLACTAPTTQATIGSYTSTGNTGTTVNWARGNGTGGVIVVGRLTSTTAVDPISGTSYTANSVFGTAGTTTGTGNYVVYSGTGTNLPVTGLASGSNYTFTVYEYNTTSTCYKVPGSSSAVITTCNPPTTQASLGTYTNNTTGSTLTANWTRGNGIGVVVVARLTATTKIDPSTGTTYTANTAFGSGTGTAITGTGNYVVYVGTGTSVNVTGLSGVTNYTFTVYEYGTGPCYNTPGSSSAVTTSNAYCIPTANSNTNTYISSFSTTSGILNISNTGTTGGVTSTGYSDYSAQSVSQKAGSSINFSATIANNASGVGIWVDWNNNGTFETGERMYTSNSSVSSASGNFTVPAGTVAGNYRMRILADRYSTNPGACSFATSFGNQRGEAEDYTFTVICVPTLTLNSNAPAAANKCAGTAKDPIQSFSITVSGGCDGNLTNVGFTTANGTYVAADISKFQLWTSGTSNSFVNATTQLGGDITTTIGNGAHTFTSFASPTLTNGSTYYYWITMDIAASPTDGHTVICNGIATTDLASTSTKAGSTTSVGGTQILKLLPMATVNSQSNLACFGVSTGQITIQASGGLAPYTFSIHNGLNSDYTGSGNPYTFNNLPAGDYRVRVKDSNQCESTIIP